MVLFWIIQKHVNRASNGGQWLRVAPVFCKPVQESREQVESRQAGADNKVDEVSSAEEFFEKYGLFDDDEVEEEGEEEDAEEEEPGPSGLGGSEQEDDQEEEEEDEEDGPLAGLVEEAERMLILLFPYVTKLPCTE